MQVIGLLLVLGLIGWVMIMPIIAIVWASNAKHRADQLDRALREQAWRLEQLQAELLRRPTREAGAREPVAEPQPAGEPPAPAPEPAMGHPAPSGPELASEPALLEPRVPVETPATPRPEPAPAPAMVPPARGFDVESWVGVRLFAWLGGSALFIGAALFLHYSMQHDLISPPVRVGIGLVAGAAAMWGGDWLRSRAEWAGQALAGAGVAILYAAIFAARSLYDLIPTPGAFAAMAAVTVVAGVMADRRRAYLLAVLGTLGGFLTPYLLSTGEDHAVALFAYVALLDLGAIAIARRTRWNSLAALALVGSVAMYIGWASTFLVDRKIGIALVAAAVIAALFVFLQPRLGAAAGEAPSRLPSVVASVAACAPPLVALSVSADLPIAPTWLVIYLLLVSAGVVHAARRTGFHPLVVVAAAACALTLLARTGEDLFPDQRNSTLLLFLLVPAAFWGLWFARRSKPEAASLRVALLIALAASLGVLVRARLAEPDSEPTIPLLAYVGAHAAGLIAVGLIERTGGWLLGAQGMMLFCFLVTSERFSPPRVWEFALPMGASMLAFWALPLAHERARSDQKAWLSSALALLLHYPIIFCLARPTWDDGVWGALAIGCGALGLITLRHARQRTPEGAARVALSALFGGVTLAFITAAVPILLRNEWLTVAWALEVAALAWLVRRVPHPGLVAVAAALAAAVCLRLLLNSALWTYHERSETPIINWYLYTFGLPALAFLVAGRLFEDDPVATRFRLPAALRILAAGLCFALLNVEVADYFSTGRTLTFHLSGGTLAEDMTYSLAWGAFALVLLILGIARRSRATRIGAMLVLTLTIGKVFMHDLWHLGELYRVASVVGLALALLAMSVLIQRCILRPEPP